MIHMNLEAFLLKAKQNGYTSGKKATKLENGFDEITYSEGPYFYRDVWYGSNPFEGGEVALENDKPVWMMNYYGFVFNSPVDAEKEVYRFLRKALAVTPASHPIRGTPLFNDGDFEYRNELTGTVEQFYGIETIY